MTDKECRHLRPLINPDNTSVMTNESSITEKKARKCFKPRYRLKKVKNRGAILILIWSYLVSSLHFYISYNASRIYSHFMFAMVQITVGLTIPLAGWLADIRFGRYKVIRFSMWTMWISSLLLTASLVILRSLDLYNCNKVHISNPTSSGIWWISSQHNPIWSVSTLWCIVEWNKDICHLVLVDYYQ